MVTIFLSGVWLKESRKAAAKATVAKAALAPDGAMAAQACYGADAHRARAVGYRCEGASGAPLSNFAERGVVDVCWKVPTCFAAKGLHRGSR